MKTPTEIDSKPGSTTSVPGASTPFGATRPTGGERHRRLRRTGALRRLVRETRLHPARLVHPVFVRPGDGVAEPIESMPGQARLSVDRVVDQAGEAAGLGVGGVLLFGVVDAKDAEGSGAWDDDGIVQRALRALVEADLGLVLAADVCLCGYTDHGHCGVLAADGVDNDATLPLLARVAVSLARAGADVVAPSAMMDGQVAAIRAALDRAGHGTTSILSYAAKYASSFYGPFRDAADSAPDSGDRKGYQMDPANAREALSEIAADIDQGADLVMVKPALAYLDVIRAARERFDVPLVAYNVSGEYAMVEAAAARGWIDRMSIAAEIATSILRAGADAIITYHALDLARALDAGTGDS